MRHSHPLKNINRGESRRNGVRLRRLRQRGEGTDEFSCPILTSVCALLLHPKDSASQSRLRRERGGMNSEINGGPAN